MTSSGDDGRRRGRETPAEARRRRAATEDLQVVVEAGARLLEVRARSVGEIRRRLTGAGYPPILVEAAIARLLDLGLLDDAAFARAWVAARDRSRPRGERALRRELELKGIDRSLIVAVLSERRRGAAITTDGDRAPTDPGSDEVVGVAGPVADPELAAAERLLARHARSLDRVGDPRLRRRRAFGLLARHGFDADTIGTALAAAERIDEA